MLLDGGRARRGLASTSVASRAAPREMASSAARRATHTSRVGALRGADAIGDAGLRAVCTLVAGRGAADARASVVRLGKAKRADDGVAGSEVIVLHGITSCYREAVHEFLSIAL